MSKADRRLIVPFAKPSGITSFSSLWQVKHLLGTRKVGHTGTLDCFADGLLVLLSGKLTKLVPYITEFDKRYLVCCRFGAETDTLDPEGVVTKELLCPQYTDFINAVAQFEGRIEQIPPVYSAVKMNGERLSDKIRRGEHPDIPTRIVTIHSITVTHVCTTATGVVSSAVMDVHCSKGTYIRSLVRDIAVRCGSAAYVQALRRTAVGPFTLDSAAGFEYLPPFMHALSRRFEDGSDVPALTAGQVAAAARPLDARMCAMLNFCAVELNPRYYRAFTAGKKIETTWFLSDPVVMEGSIAVLYQDRCIGFVIKQGLQYSYKTVFG